MLTGSFGQKGDPGVYFVEGARKEWRCRLCDDADRLFFVVYRPSSKAKEQVHCLPCVLRRATHGRASLRDHPYFPASLIKKLDNFVVMENLRDSSKKKEEGV